MPASHKAKASTKNTAIGCVAILVILGVIGAISGGGSKQVQTAGANASATVAPAAATSNATALQLPPGPTTPPAPTPTQPAVVVANTDRQGVFIRRSPSAEDKIKVWPDGTVMQPVGPDQQTDGRTWRNVQDPEGNQGWVPAEYLALPTPTPAPSARPDRSRYQLELLAVSGSWQYGYATVEGQVKNISGKSLQNVAAVAEWYIADGQFITSDTALIEYNPVLAGQSSPFKVISTHNLAISKYRISFKSLFGGQIPTLDSRAR